MNVLNFTSSSFIFETLKVCGVFKTPKDFSFEVNISIKKGERIALVGKSGSGKTTFLRMIAGLESFQKPDKFKSTQSEAARGKVFLGEQDITCFSPQKREIGFLFQDLALFSGLNVFKNIVFALEVRGIPYKMRLLLAQQWLEKMGLSSRKNAFIEELSGGEKQRIALIRAMIWRPRILLLDEPFTGLDSEWQNLVRSEILAFHHFWPVPLLMVTHDPMDLSVLATRVFTLNQEEGSTIRKIQESC